MIVEKDFLKVLLISKRQSKGGRVREKDQYSLHGTGMEKGFVKEKEVRQKACQEPHRWESGAEK